MNAVDFTEFKKTKRTTKNPINKSGKSGEVLFEKTLISIFPDLPYRRTKSGKRGIDFRINPCGKPEDRMYIDIKFQHTSGGRDLAVGGTAWKYKKDYGYNECYIAEGPYDFTDEVREFANLHVKTHFVKFDKMIDILRKEYYGKNSKKQIVNYFI